MKGLSCQFEGLADRPGFNATVRHIKTAIAVIERVNGKENLADILDELVESKAIDKDEVLPVVTMVLGDKFHYRAVSANLTAAATDLVEASEQIAQWNAVDLVLVYHHPDLGVIAVNPKNKKRVGRIDRVNRSELLVAWAGCFAKEGAADLLDSAALAAIDVLSGKKPKLKPELLKGDCVYKQILDAAEKAEAKKMAQAKAKAEKPVASKSVKATAKKSVQAPVVAPPLEEHKAAVQAERALKPGSRMTPMYSVRVSNELFHNGNVEAWKRIIDSYRAKNPSLEVLVYYDSERITNLNALFKWGKVKHGSSIQFAIAGDEIRDVAKLQRYLAQGASSQFEAFLRGPVNAILSLF